MKSKETSLHISLKNSIIINKNYIDTLACLIAHYNTFSIGLRSGQDHSTVQILICAFSRRCAGANSVMLIFNQFWIHWSLRELSAVFRSNTSTWCSCNSFTAFLVLSFLTSWPAVVTGLKLHFNVTVFRLLHLLTEIQM